MGNEINGNISSGVIRNTKYIAKSVSEASVAVSRTLQDTYQSGGGLDQASAKINALRTMVQNGTRGWKALQSGPPIKKAQNVNGNNSRVSTTKASYIFKMANLVEWPNENGKGDLNMAVVDDMKMSKAMEEFEGKMIRGQRVRLVKVKSPDDLKKLDVKMLYINPESPKFNSFFNRTGTSIGSSNTLVAMTTGSSSREIGRGHAFSFIEKKGRVRFSINVDEVRRRSVKISPRLVKVASSLVTDRGKSPGSK